MYRIRVKKLPTAKAGLSMGDQSNFGLYVAGPGNNFLPKAQYGNVADYFNQGMLQNMPANNAYMMQAGGMVPANPYPVQQNIQPVNRDEANIEAERGETVTGDFDQDGMTEHLAIGGKRHSEGGTPLNVPPGAFVFSDTKKMRIGGPILQEFGKSGDSKKKYTPAELAKQYDLNKYKAILQDPNSGKLEKDTAQLMLDNNQTKLGKLALLQEAMKGFPNGVPGIAMPLIQSGTNNPPELEVGAPTTKAAYGYYNPPVTGPVDPPVDPYGGDKNNPRQYQRQNLKLARGFNKYNTPWLKDYGYENTPAGLSQALLDTGYQGDLNDVKGVQKFLINENIKTGNSDLFDSLLHNYGMTNQGIKGGLHDDEYPYDPDMIHATWVKGVLEKAYADGAFGVRSGEMLKSLLPRDLKRSQLSLIPDPHAVPDMSHFIPNPTINPPPLAPPPPRPVQTGAQPQWKQPADIPMNWWTQDKINLAAALGNRYNLKKYMPTYVSPGVVLPTPTFFDPTRQLAANQEQAAAQNMMAAMFAGPQRERAVGSNIQGQASTNAANILAQVANQNVGVANQFAGITSETLNNRLQQEANARKIYLDANTVANQQFDNGKAAANNIAHANLLSGISNAEKTYWLNRTNNQFNIDPSTGQLSFVKGKWLGDRGSAGSTTSPAQLYSYHYNDFKKSNPGLEKLDEKAHEYAMKRINGPEKTTAVDPQLLLNYISQMQAGNMGGYPGYNAAGYNAGNYGDYEGG